MSTLACPVGPSGEAHCISKESESCNLRPNASHDDVTPITVMCKLQKAQHEWAKALSYDGLEDGDEVAFSNENPHVKRYDELIIEFEQLNQILERRNR